MTSEYTQMCCSLEQKVSAAQHVAGVSSAFRSQVTGQTMEPSILRKRRVEILPHNSTGSPAGKEYILLGNQRKFTANVPYRLHSARNNRPAKANDATMADKVIKLVPNAPVASFDPGKPSPKKKSKTASPQKVIKNLKRIENKTPKVESAESLAVQAVANSNNNNNNNNNNYNNNNNNNNNSGSSNNNNNSGSSNNKNNNNSSSNNNNNSETRKKVGSIADKQNNDNAKGSSGKGQKVSTTTVDEKLEYLMKYRAGLAPKRSAAGRKKTEYQKMYKWKRCERATPLLAASQLIYNNNSEMQPSAAAAPPAATEYRSQYQAWLSPAQLNKETNNNNNNNNNNNRDDRSNRNCDDKDEIPSAAASQSSLPVNQTMSKLGLACDKSSPPTAGLLSKTVHEPITRQIYESPDSPVKLVRPPTSDWLSEYGVNYQPFTQFSYDQGVWKGAIAPHKNADRERPVGDKAHVSVDAAGSWFAEVKELREKAEEYRRRARGMHFSREHVGQLLATQAKMWDASTVSGSLSQLSLSDAKALCSTSGGKAEPLPDIVQQAGTHRLAWSQDGSRSTSESDTVRSIRSGQPLEEMADGSEGQFEEEMADHGEGQTQKEVADQGEGQTQKVAGKGEGHDRSSSFLPHSAPSARQPSLARCDCSPEQGESKWPAAGRPTIDSHGLVDEQGDEVMETKYLPSMSVSPARPTSGAGLKTVPEGAAETYNIPIAKSILQGRDVGELGSNREEGSHRSLMSSSTLSLAGSSSSLANELLERAEKRRAEFWETRKKPSRK